MKYSRKLCLLLFFNLFISSQLFSSGEGNDCIKGNFIEKLECDWKIFPAKKIKYNAEKISTPGTDVRNWYSTEVPSTVMAALIRNEVFTDVFMGDNLERIDKEQFKSPWWYRKEFTPKKDKNIELVLEGLVYKANLWLNGELVADSNEVEGVFRTFRFDITDKLIDGVNCLAVEIVPPKPLDLTIGFVDWNPTPNDNNMGLWRGVHLEYSDAVSMKHSAAFSDVNVETLKSADVFFETTLKNHSNKKQRFKLKAEIDGINLSKDLSLNPKEEKVFKFNKTDFPQLVFNNPKLWWPNGFGEQNLYNLDLHVELNGKISDAEKIRFGIRKVEDYVTEEGHRGYKVNGKKVLIKSAGWVDDIFLSDSDDKVKAQMLYVKNMNLNSVRLEGFWGSNKTLYNCADEYGILLMVGFSCHWEWEKFGGRPTTDSMAVTSDRDIEIQGEGYRDQVLYLRNHPSVFVWGYGSDKLPTRKFEMELNKHLYPLDTTRPILTSCRYRVLETGALQTSTISGPTRVKMLGPYGYVPPIYWYEDDKLGGAYGFNTETGPGPQIPPVESIKKMIPAKDLWPINKMWEYHSGRKEFQTLERYLDAFNKRYGESESLEDFAMFSQVSNYEAMRGMFEAFKVNMHNATGVVQWMLNSAWPEMFWQLYDWYLMPNGAFYATQDACKPLNLIYNYLDDNIYVSNELYENKNGLTAIVKVYDINSKLLLDKTIKFEVEENIAKKIYDLPVIENLSETYFVDLRLQNQSGNEIADNFYWLSKNKDVMDYDIITWVYTPLKKYADLKQLRTMEKVSVDVESKFEKREEKTKATIKIANRNDKIAFCIETLIVDDKTGNSILPAILSDNYFSLLPGEIREIKVEVFNKDLKGKTPKIKIQGINLK